MIRRLFITMAMLLSIAFSLFANYGSRPILLHLYPTLVDTSIYKDTLGLLYLDQSDSTIKAIDKNGVFNLFQYIPSAAESTFNYSNDSLYLSDSSGAVLWTFATDTTASTKTATLFLKGFDYGAVGSHGLYLTSQVDSADTVIFIGSINANTPLYLLGDVHIPFLSIGSVSLTSFSTIKLSVDTIEAYTLDTIVFNNIIDGTITNAAWADTAAVVLNDYYYSFSASDTGKLSILATDSAIYLCDSSILTTDTTRITARLVRTSTVDGDSINSRTINNTDTLRTTVLAANADSSRIHVDLNDSLFWVSDAILPLRTTILGINNLYMFDTLKISRVTAGYMYTSDSLRTTIVFADSTKYNNTIIYQRNDTLFGYDVGGEFILRKSDTATYAVTTDTARVLYDTLLYPFGASDTGKLSILATDSFFVLIDSTPVVIDSAIITARSLSNTVINTDSVTSSTINNTDTLHTCILSALVDSSRIYVNQDDSLLWRADGLLPQRLTVLGLNKLYIQDTARFTTVIGGYLYTSDSVRTINMHADTARIGTLAYIYSTGDSLFAHDVTGDYFLRASGAAAPDTVIYAWQAGTSQVVINDYYYPFGVSDTGKTSVLVTDSAIYLIDSAVVSDTTRITANTLITTTVSVDSINSRTINNTDTLRTTVLAANTDSTRLYVATTDTLVWRGGALLGDQTSLGLNSLKIVDASLNIALVRGGYIYSSDTIQTVLQLLDTTKYSASSYIYQRSDTLFGYDAHGEFTLYSATSDTAAFAWNADSLGGVAALNYITDADTVTYADTSFYSAYADSSGITYLAYNADSLNHVEAAKYILNTDTVIYSDTAFYAVNTSIPDSVNISAYSWTAHGVDTIVDSSSLSLNSNLLNSLSSIQFLRSDVPDTGVYSLWDSLAVIGKVLFNADYIFSRGDSLFGYDVNGEYYLGGGSSAAPDTVLFAWSADSLSHYPVDSFLLKSDNIAYAESAGVAVVSYTSRNSDSLGSLAPLQFLRSDITDTLTKLVFGSSYFTQDTVRSKFLLGLNDTLFVSSDKSVYYIDGRHSFNSTHRFILDRPASNKTITLVNLTGARSSSGVISSVDTFYRSFTYFSVSNTGVNYVSAGDSLFLAMSVLSNDIMLVPIDTLNKIFGDTVLTINLEGTAGSWEVYFDKMTYLADTIIECIASRVLVDTLNAGDKTTEVLLKSDLDSLALIYPRQVNSSILYRVTLKALSDNSDFNVYSYKLYFN